MNLFGKTPSLKDVMKIQAVTVTTVCSILWSVKKQGLEYTLDTLRSQVNMPGFEDEFMALSWKSMLSVLDDPKSILEEE